MFARQLSDPVIIPLFDFNPFAAAYYMGAWVDAQPKVTFAMDASLDTLLTKVDRYIRRELARIPGITVGAITMLSGHQKTFQVQTNADYWQLKRNTRIGLLVQDECDGGLVVQVLSLWFVQTIIEIKG